MFRRISRHGSKTILRRKVSSSASHDKVALKSHFTFTKRRSALVTLPDEFNCKVHVFKLLETFLNICYILLLVPFRFGKNAQGLVVRKKNIVQQILCSLLIILVILYSLLDFRQFLERDLKKNPEDAFSYATGVIIHMIPICWSITFWWRAENFDGILFVCQHQYHHQYMPDTACVISRNPNPQLIWFLNLTILITFIRFFLQFYVYNDDGSVESYLNYIVGSALYNVYLNDKKFVGISTDMRLNSTVLMTVAYPLAVADNMFNFEIVLFEQFCLTGALMVYAACANFSQELERSSLSANNSVQMQRIIKSISTNYLDLVSALEATNKVFGPSVLLFFMYLYPLFIWSIFDRTGGGPVLITLLHVYDMAILLVVTGIAAAGSAKLGKFKQWVFRVSMSDFSPSQTTQSAAERTSLTSEAEVKVDELNSQERLSEKRFLLSTIHRELSTEVIGLRGCNFFTITYNFVGTMTGIMITYAIVMLQFIEKQKIDNVDMCTINETAGNCSLEF